jgi:hypothetical protein
MSNNTNNTNTTNNTKKYTLLVPFDDKDIVKKLGAKWDSVNKNWYFMGDLPEELQKYKSYPVFIEYDDKDLFKTKYKSLRWNPTKKNWLCNETDYRAITA